MGVQLVLQLYTKDSCENKTLHTSFLLYIHFLQSFLHHCSRTDSLMQRHTALVALTPSDVKYAWLLLVWDAKLLVMLLLL